MTKKTITIFPKDTNRFSHIDIPSIQEMIDYLRKHDSMPCNFQNVKWKDINMDNLDLTGWRLNSSTFINCTFKGSVLERVHCEEVKFINCDFSEAISLEGIFNKSQFVDCTFNGTNLVDVSCLGTVFTGCTFLHAMITGNSEAFRDSTMERCKLRHVRISDGVFRIKTQYCDIIDMIRMDFPEVPKDNADRNENS